MCVIAPVDSAAENSMLLRRNGAPPAFARVFGSGEQLLGVRVRDDQLAFGVGEQDRIGDGVDDAVEQHPLLSEPRPLEVAPAST